MALPLYQSMQNFARQASSHVMPWPPSVHTGVGREEVTASLVPRVQRVNEAYAAALLMGLLQECSASAHVSNGGELPGRMSS